MGKLVIPVGIVFIYNVTSYWVLASERRTRYCTEPTYLLLSEDGHVFWSELQAEFYDFNFKTNVLEIRR